MFASPVFFYRGGAEQKIRQYLVDNNYVETVISLAPNPVLRYHHCREYSGAVETQNRY